MVLLTFFGSTLPDHVHIGPISLRMRRFVSRPLQCFSCYGYGHGKSYCKDASRCGNCSTLGSHSEEQYDAVSYYFHCSDAHQIRSRQRPRYCLEKDILQFTNSQFISLGSARHERLYRQKDVESFQRYDGNPLVLTKVTHAVDVHSPPVSPKPLKGLTKCHRGSLESIDLAQAKQSKIAPAAHGRESFRDHTAMAASMVSVEPPVTPSVSDRASYDENALERESSDDVTAVPRGPTVAKVECGLTLGLRFPVGMVMIHITHRRARARRVLREAQRASWKAYFSSINVHTLLTDVFNKVRRIAGKYSAPSPPIVLSAWRTVADLKTVADLFAKHFASVSWKDPAAPSARYRQSMESLGINFSSSGGESYNVPFPVSELRTTLSQCHDSSPGPDDIPYAFLRHIPDYMTTETFPLINHSV
ncbi:hypothetical protein E2C01_028921 [Portunus trituberculatus]|uniref:Uncharacterized protein n=1 Tax=Portunus trituberculatus TaxID=210409 RepID=A0A5B7EQF8_PORTR|nr:hypothetical protein [Portunus trituberculatus]